MQYVFWQNILSIHQAPFLKELAEKNEVTLVVESELDSIRIKDGWNIPDFGNAQILISPDSDVINQLLLSTDAIHIFSGINLSSRPLLKKAFSIAINNKLRIGIMSEPFNWLGLSGKLRFLKYVYLRIKYMKYISFLLVIGDKGRWCYEKIGFSADKMFDWGYFTKSSFSENNNQPSLTQNPNLIYIGRLNKDKGIVPLVKLSLKYTDLFSNFVIIGDGDCKNEIQQLIKDQSQYQLLGNIPNDEIYKILSNTDLCILPSIGKDGWGAVVNEALMSGNRVIASNYCGASVLLDEKFRGGIFNVENNNLEDVFSYWVKKGSISVEERLVIKHWANKNISGSAASHYFQNIVDYIMLDKGNLPIAPWLKDK